MAVAEILGKEQFMIAGFFCIGILFFSFKHDHYVTLKIVGTKSDQKYRDEGNCGNNKSQMCRMGHIHP